jgi:phosphate transport system substrate-binding protein
MKRTLFPLLVSLVASLLPAVGHAADAVKVDDTIAAYDKVSGVSGNLNSIGSDTLNNLMTLWAEGFRKQYPNVRIQVEGKGSSTAPPALIAGSAQIGPMSREMKPTEIDEFEKKYGYKPTAIEVAIDGLEVFVNKDNPIEKLTVPQVDAVFSKTRLCGAPADVTTWGDLGATGVWASRGISLYGRNSASGTYGYFKEHALCKGDYRDTVKEQPGSSSVVQGISADPNGIGYSGMGYRTSSVKALAIAAKDGGAYVTAEPENIYAGKYPLSRFLYLYVNKAPNQPLDPLVREFLRYVISKQGQEVVIKDGFLPLTASIVARERKDLE